MLNPFESLETRLSNIESILLHLSKQPAPVAPAEINNPDELLTIEELSKEIKTPIPTIRRKADKIGFIKHGRRLLFRRSDVIRFLEANSVKGRAQIQSEAIQRLKAVR